MGGEIDIEDSVRLEHGVLGSDQKSEDITLEARVKLDLGDYIELEEGVANQSGNAGRALLGVAVKDNAASSHPSQGAFAEVTFCRVALGLLNKCDVCRGRKLVKISGHCRLPDPANRVESITGGGGGIPGVDGDRGRKWARNRGVLHLAITARGRNSIGQSGIHTGGSRGRARHGYCS